MATILFKIFDACVIKEIASKIVWSKLAPACFFFSLLLGFFV